MVSNHNLLYNQPYTITNLRVTNMDNVNTAEKKQYNIIVQPEVIVELERIQKRLMELVDSDEDFAAKIIEYSLLCGTGKGIYRNNVDSLVWKKYPGIHTDSRLIGEGKHELFPLIYYFTNMIIGQHKLIKKYLIHNIPREDWEIYKDQLRPLIEKEIIRIFYPGDVEDNEISTDACDIIGDVTEQLDDMDI